MRFLRRLHLREWRFPGGFKAFLDSLLDDRQITVNDLLTDC